MRTALVIEDDRAIQDLMRELLREQGFDSVLTASQPEVAVHLATTHPVDLVVLDYVLPGSSGVEVAEELRALPGFRAPVLVTTALPAKQAQKACDHAGACGCVLKPFDITAFLESVQACLEGSREATAR